MEARFFDCVFAYKKGTFIKRIEAKNYTEAKKLALEYQKEDNKGEPKSERIRLHKIIH